MSLAVACSQTLFKVRRAHVIKYKPQGICADVFEKNEKKKTQRLCTGLLSSENKAVDCPELTNIVCTQGAGAHFCAQEQGRDLVLRQRHRARSLAWVLEKRVCSH